MVEPWLRGTWTEVDALRRQVLHALELAREDCARWCAGLSDEELNARPFDVTPVAYHLRHMARSLDRLLTYAEGGALSEEQLRQLAGELDGWVAVDDALREFEGGIAIGMQRVLRISPESFEETRWVGRARLPSTAGGLVVHCAEHTQRHAGQAVTTARMLIAMRGERRADR